MYIYNIKVQLTTDLINVLWINILFLCAISRGKLHLGKINKSFVLYSKIGKSNLRTKHRLYKT